MGIKTIQHTYVCTVCSNTEQNKGPSHYQVFSIHLNSLHWSIFYTEHISVQLVLINVYYTMVCVCHLKEKYHFEKK